MADRIRNLLENETVFEVEKIKDIRLWGGKIEYLVKWANTVIDSNETLARLSPFLFSEDGRREVTININKTEHCRELVWSDSWVGLMNLDCHELIMQYHLDEKNSLKDEVTRLRDEVNEVKEENLRLKSSNASLIECVRSNPKRSAVCANVTTQTESEELVLSLPGADYQQDEDASCAQDLPSHFEDTHVTDDGLSKNAVEYGKRKKIRNEPLMGRFQCTSCKKQFSFKSGLDRHMMLHNGQVFRCDSCHSTFTRKDNLRRHVEMAYCIAHGGGSSTNDPATSVEK